ncbi:unnamed protein product [Symbiodinium sp. KB8]|nr:unnamed protein product [Symbiodinium sp. KB8]
MEHAPALLDLHAEAIWLSRARRAKKARKSFQHGQSCKEDVPMLSISEQDLKAEAAALRRAHRAVGSQYPRSLNTGYMSPSQSSPGQEGLVEAAEGFEATEDPSPVASRGLRGDGSSDREEELRARLDVAEDLLEKTRPQAQEAARLRRRLAASESRAAEMEATSCAALRLCQELSAALELQNVEFQRYVDAIRRQTGPFLEQTAFIEAELGAVASSSPLQGEGEAARLLEELQSEQRQRRQKESELGEVRLQLERTVTDLQDAESRANELSAKLTHSEMEQNQDPGALEDHQEQGDSSAEAEAPIDQRDPASPLRQDQLIEEKRNRAQQRKQRRMDEAALPQGRAAASAITSLSKGMVVRKLCAGTLQWQPRLMQLSPAPPAGPQKLIWSKDIGRRVFGRRLTSLDLKEVTNVGLGADSLPDKLRHKEAGWRCFSVWTAQRSFFFKAGSDKEAEHAVLALSRLCPATQPIPLRSVILHRAVGKLGPDPAARAATLLQALRQAGRGKEEFVEQQEEPSEGEESSSPSDDIEETDKPGLAEAETRFLNMFRVTLPVGSDWQYDL